MASSGSNQNQAFQATAVVTQGKYLLLIIINLYLPIKGVCVFFCLMPIHHIYYLHTKFPYNIIANGQPPTQTVSSQIRVQQQQLQGIQVQQATHQQQQFVTLPGGQQVAVRMATASAQPQVMQFPAQQQIQQMVPVQIPVSQNGQTVYQTVQMPVAAQTIQTAMIPQVIQTASGQQQIVMQQVQIAQPQIAQQPQFAQILMPNGQIQQVPVVQPQMLGGIGGIQIPAQQQIAIQQQQSTSSAGGSAVTTTTSSASTAVASTTSSGSTSSMINAKVEPVEIKSEAPESETKSSQQVQQQQQPQQQQQQFVAMNLNGQQVMVQQPVTVNQGSNPTGK